MERHCFECVNTIQCLKCYRFGHIQFDCKFEESCKKCADKHITNTCTADTINCSNCSRYNKNICVREHYRTNHLATDDRCPVRILRIEGIKNLYQRHKEPLSCAIKNVNSTANTNSNIIIYSQNISGRKEKVLQINNKLAYTPYSIILLQETWFNNTVSSSEIINMTEFEIFRRGRSETSNTRSLGGGVCTLIKKNLHTERISTITNTIAETVVTITTMQNSQKVIIVNTYIPPYYVLNSLMEATTIIKKLQKSYPSTV